VTAIDEFANTRGNSLLESDSIAKGFEKGF